MEKSTEPQPSTQWFVFFKDQLLLKKGYTDKGEIKYSVPVSIEPPLTPEAGSNIHEVFPPNGKQVRAFALEQPVAETDEWVMIGLRASYDYISPDEYRSAGKAFQILYWDEHSHFCPVCGTAMEHQTPIMKKCPNCGNEMYPPVSTAIIVLIRKGDESCWCMPGTSEEPSTDWWQASSKPARHWKNVWNGKFLRKRG